MNTFVKLIPFTGKLSQHELYSRFGFTELPWGIEIIEARYTDIPELVLGLHECRHMNLEEQCHTGICEDFQEWYWNERVWVY